MNRAWWMPLVISIALAGCRWSQPQSDGSGTIECTEVHVAPQVAGRIAHLPPQEGDAVKEGDIVAELDATDYRLRKDEAVAALAAAQAQLDLLKAGSREEDVQRAREQVREAKAAAQAAEADRQRVKSVFDRSSATARQMDEAAALAERTAAAVAGAEQNLARFLKGSRAEEIRAAEAQAEVCRARLALTEKAVADCTVKSPITGIVTTRVREAGEVVAQGATLLSISRLDEVWLSVYVPEPRLSTIRIGQPARVRPDGDARLYDGVVTYVSPQAEFTPRNVQTPDERAKLVYRVKITLKNPDGLFKPGMPADALLSAGGQAETKQKPAP
jgi:HlyD family secretion protein